MELAMYIHRFSFFLACFLLIHQNSFAAVGFKSLNADNRYKTQEEASTNLKMHQNGSKNENSPVSSTGENYKIEPKIAKKKQKRQQIVSKVSSADQQTIQKLDETNRILDELLKQKAARPTIIDGTFNFMTGDVLRGILLNSIVSTNLESPALVAIKEGQGLPPGTKFSCRGVTKNRRVVIACDLMIVDKEEYEVETLVLNTDGSAGVKGEYYSGSEEYVAAAVATSFAKGVLDISKQKVMGPFGNTLTVDSLKNQLAEGTSSSIDKATDIMEQEMRSKEPKVYINAGEEVLIYFNRKFETRGMQNEKAIQIGPKKQA